MARTNNLTNFLTDVASAIKTKTGDSTAIPASQFDTKIANITTGHLDNEEYETSNDKLDEILEGTEVPTGTKQISITQNGTTTEDVTNYTNAQITTNVVNQDYEDALVAFGVEEDLADSIEALTTYSNEVTGESDTTLSDAVRTLADGYGGVADKIELFPNGVSFYSQLNMRSISGEKNENDNWNILVNAAPSSGYDNFILKIASGDFLDKIIVVVFDFQFGENTIFIDASNYDIGYRLSDVPQTNFSTKFRNNLSRNTNLQHSADATLSVTDIYINFNVSALANVATTISITNLRAYVIDINI